MKKNFGEIGITGHQLHFGNRLKPEPAWMKFKQNNSRLMQAKDARDQYAGHVSLEINILDAMGLEFPPLEEEKKEEA